VSECGTLYSLPVIDNLKTMPIAAALLANRPNLSKGTIKTYVSIITNLAKQAKVAITCPADVIHHYKPLLEHMGTQTPMSRKSRLAALIVFIEKSEGAEPVVKAIREKMMEDIKTCEASDDEGTKNAKQEAAMIPWAEVLQKYESLKAKAEPLLMGKAALSRQEFQLCQLYVLMSCFVLIPPRRSLDYTEFRIRNADDTVNYMMMEKRKPQFVFNVYKTARKYNKQTVAIPPALYKIVQAWGKHNTHDWLLMNVGQTNKLTPTALTKLFNDFFQKKISTSMLRHIYLSDVYKDVPAMKEMKERAAAMGQSVQVALGKYVKK